MQGLQVRVAFAGQQLGRLQGAQRLREALEFGEDGAALRLGGMGGEH
jgi:hypothetical protein